MDITRAILRINPDAKFVCWENDFNRIEYNDFQHTGVKPTLEQCEKAWVEIELEVTNNVPTIEERISGLENALLDVLLGGL